MAQSGLNKDIGKATYKKANKKIADLTANINALKQAVQTMNQSVWYGGASANKWYNSVSNTHTSNSKFVASADELQKAIKKNLDEIDRASNI